MTQGSSHAREYYLSESIFTFEHIFFLGELATQADSQPNPVLHGLNMKTNFLVTESHSLFDHYEPSLASFGLPSF